VGAKGGGKESAEDLIPNEYECVKESLGGGIRASQGGMK